MLIEGFGIAGYRSFGPELQRISPCAKVNLLVGQNNSGKSNVLLFLKWHLKKAIQALGRSPLSLDSLERHIGAQDTPFVFALSMPFDGRAFKAIEASLPDARFKHYANAILRSPAFSLGDTSAWFVFNPGQATSPSGLAPDFVETVMGESPISRGEWGDLWKMLTRQGAGNFEQHWAPETLSRFAREVLIPPEVSLIPAIRQIDERGAVSEDDHSGIGLIKKLALLQNPPVDKRQLRERFERINLFLRSVIGNTSATLEVPYERDMILVHMDGRSLPLSSLGTGIHEVTILAAAATALSNQVLCIEEPELHLSSVVAKEACQVSPREDR